MPLGTIPLARFDLGRRRVETRAREVTILNLKFYCIAGLARPNQGHQRIKRVKSVLRKILSGVPGWRSHGALGAEGRGLKTAELPVTYVKFYNYHWYTARFYKFYFTKMPKARK